MRTYPDVGAVPSTRDLDGRRPGPIARFLSSFAAAREAAEIYDRLSALNDDQLAGLGLAREDVARVAAEPILRSH